MPATTPYFPPLFIINLERSSDRRAHISSQLDTLGLQYEFFTATDGARLSEEELADYDEAYAAEQIGRPLSLPEVGCYFSHTRLWQKIVDEGIPWAVILEDDIKVQGDFKHVLAAVSTLPCNWEIIRLAGLKPTPLLSLHDLGHGYALAALLQPASGTQAMCVSRAGAKKLLGYARPKVRGTIDDHVLDQAWKTGLRILAVQPYPISDNRKLNSTIETERRKIFSARRSKPSLLAFRAWLARRRYKLDCSIGRRAYIMLHALFWLLCKVRLFFGLRR